MQKLMKLIGVFLFLSCISTTSSAKEPLPLARKVDHFFVVSDQAKSLCAYFKDQFQLPEIPQWPCGLSLGNAVLEFNERKIRSGSNVLTFPKIVGRLETEFRGIAFEPTANADAIALELTRRNIPHSEVNRVTEGDWRYTTIGLAEGTKASTVLFFCDYSGGREIWRASLEVANEQSNKINGGPLGILAVKEITIGAKDLAEAQSKWETLLSPSPRFFGGVLAFASGPQIRLVHAEPAGIQGIILKVRSIAKAEKFLKQHQLLDGKRPGQISIKPSAIGGLSITLVDK